MTFGFLDMDGILVDFVEGACVLHGRPNPYGETKGQYDLDVVFGMTPEEFWSPMDYNFWAGLPKTHDSHLIVDMVKAYFPDEKLAILSSPSKMNTGHCVAGKTHWIQTHLPFLARSYIYAPKKKFLGAPGRVLIDDFEKNIEGFTAAGGQAFLYPRPWNSRHAESDQALVLLEAFLKEVTKV